MSIISKILAYFDARDSLLREVDNLLGKLKAAKDELSLEKREKERLAQSLKLIKEECLEKLSELQNKKPAPPDYLEQWNAVKDHYKPGAAVEYMGLLMWVDKVHDYNIKLLGKKIYADWSGIDTSGSEWCHNRPSVHLRYIDAQKHIRTCVLDTPWELRGIEFL